MRLLPYILLLSQVPAPWMLGAKMSEALAREVIMPIYEFACAPCNNAFEAYVHTFAQRTEPRPCPVCEQPAPYAGLSTPAVGREQHFGLIMNDGGHLRGRLK